MRKVVLVFVTAVSVLFSALLMDSDPTDIIPPVTSTTSRVC